MKRKNFNLNEIFTYNNLYESYKSVCKSCRSKYKKTFFSFFLYSNLTDILNELKNNTYKFSKYNIFIINDPKFRIIMSDQMNDKIVNNNHEVKMIDRCILNITGIKKIINFTLKRIKQKIYA